MLTKRQKQILDYIEEYIEENDYSPSLEEIKRKFRLSSVSTVHQHVESLKEKGCLRKTENQHRSIELNGNKKNNLVSLPLAGTIAAGEPIEAIEDSETVEVSKSQLSKTGRHYALKVQGNSMIEEGIFNGDIVVIRKQPTAENEETVIALINENEVTLKKIYKERGGFRLQPANPKIKPIFTKELAIQGKVVSVIRNFKELKEKTKEKEFNDATIEYMEKTDIKHRKSFGQYFTPRSIRKALIDKLPKNKNNPKILDPANGTGEFLVTAKKHFKNPDLFGWDIDKNLANIARKIIPEATIKKTDSLLNEDYGKYDFVIGNPPYYEFSPSDEIKDKFREIINGRVNIFSLFIYQGIKWLKKGGCLAYVVPPSMNNGAYFSKLREYIVENTNIEYLHVLDDPKLFNKALQSTMLIVLKKGKNKGNYIFKKNGILIFSENPQYLQKSFKKSVTLHDLDFEAKTGRLVWNKNKELLTNNPKKGVPLIWAHNITEKGLRLSLAERKKPQYVKTNNYDIGPAIVVNRITGSVKSSKLKAAVIPPRMKFIAENHVNVIFPSSNQKQIRMKLTKNKASKKITLGKIASQLSSKEKLEFIKNITGNTQISKTELEKLFPINI